ncbi:rhodanese-like domain-containing protein [Acidovorax sp. NCPPB 4044]|uniref:rhodanese-like domain-containing protein n=1 Tax=Acidovorax sp. NCPPB 4044 TaxID=2940490 RepID=UPI002303F031|nr:rhodanese-like domain-containing protein [Acidovorax sp. NCPPB 4044]MDA8521175.1 rhodanese-like domain-containing protein [Acidovorax sp. NCPPB 4044]
MTAQLLAPYRAVTAPGTVLQALRARTEIALLDVREEATFALGHPLFAANLPLGRIEVEAWARIPRRSTPIVVYDDSEGLAVQAVQALHRLGYTEVSELAGGLQGWRDTGGELFIDVNVPSKAFGEWLEARRHTPSLSALEVKALLDARSDVVVLDARRFDEYQTMNIPGSTSVPGAELVLRARSLAPDAATRIIVNCAGRTRSIIGTQSLVNAGIPNPVAALRNGTIGWLLAGQALEHGAGRRPGPVEGAARADAAIRARAVADRAGVRRAKAADLQRFAAEAGQRTTYRIDVRSPEEYAQGHVPGWRNVPGGQLVQETDHTAPVRGARIVLVDGEDATRADMTASWLAQMGWEAWVWDDAADAARTETGSPPPLAPEPAGPLNGVSPRQLARWLGLVDEESAGAAAGGAANVAVLDFTASARHVQRHIPGAWFALRSALPAALAAIPRADRYVLTCGTGFLARYAAQDVARWTGAPVSVLEGGTQAWIDAGLPLDQGEAHLASPRTDRYRRPYEGTDAPREAMQAYLDWEFGLIAQLDRDGTHAFTAV